MRTTIRKNIKKYLFEVQEGKCKKCHKELGRIYDVDHVIPFSISEDNSEGNLQLLCPNCHAEKSRGGERRRINIFKIAFKNRQPHCWNCWKRVSPYFFSKYFCNKCETQILEDNLVESLKNFTLNE
jgi:Zn finger protein HypA/HybF involved in hydrogenase expression